MKQQSFEKKYSDSWKKIENSLNSKSSAGATFPAQYRALCQQYVIAKQRRYSANLVAYLNSLVLDSHRYLYSHNKSSNWAIIEFLFSTFPYTLRKNRGFVGLSTALFLLPGLVAFLACLFGENTIYSLMPADNVYEMESMYDPDSYGSDDRDSSSDILMFGFYIKNNIGIAFRTFAGGILFGLGSIFFLVYNGIVIGGVAGYLTHIGYHSTFYPFVIGHGSFELTAIVFAGAAGLKIGYALIKPGQKTRIRALQTVAKEAAIIMLGATVMLVIAAFVEAFWSSTRAFPASIKYSVGAGLWFLVAFYFLYFGRQHAVR